MDEFKNVTVVKKANVYFDGKVTSRTIRFENGSKKTLGFMLPGEYEFTTDASEVIEILSGTCGALLSGTKEWKKIKAGSSFDVPGNSKFKIKVLEAIDYCCSFV